jgi:hypothetical protein
MIEALSSSETPVLTRATQSNIPEDAILPVILLDSICLDGQPIRGHIYVITLLETRDY